MKKLILMLGMVSAITLISCGETAAEKASKKADQTLKDCERIKDSINGNEQPDWYYEL